MEKFVTKTGKVLTDADIDALAAEAEKGYDVQALIEKSSLGTPGARALRARASDEEVQAALRRADHGTREA